MRTHHYPSDITDAQWALIEPHIPAEPGGGRPRKTDMRDVLDAVLYILRTGCQWRYLPVDFPPKSTVWRYFDQWRRDGTLGPDPRPAPPQGPHGGEALPSPDLRERRQPVDRHHLRRRAAGPRQLQECRRPEAAYRRRQHGVAAGRPGHGRLRRRRQRRPRRCSPDWRASRWARSCGCTPISKYHNFKLYEWVEENAAWDLSIVRRPEGERGWVKLPIRWTVERTFAWLGHCRRLSKDREKSVLSSESFIKLAMIQLMFHRLRPSHTDPEFHYRSAA